MVIFVPWVFYLFGPLVINLAVQFSIYSAVWIPPNGLVVSFHNKLLWNWLLNNIFSFLGTVTKTSPTHCPSPISLCQFLFLAFYLCLYLSLNLLSFSFKIMNLYPTSFTYSSFFIFSVCLLGCFKFMSLSLSFFISFFIS